MTTISARIHAARGRLERAGIPHDEAALDARLLAEHALGWNAVRTLAEGTEPEPPGFSDRYEALLERRAHREPVAYITGSREFWNLTFEVTPDVLIPRPETEGLVEAFLALFPARDRPLGIVDVCTGSGCIGVAIASERPRADIVATDVSAAGLDVARRNAARLGVAPRIRFVRSNVLDGLDGPFDAVVSNPPYVPIEVRDSLQPEVRDFEPAVALFAGRDGLSVITTLIDESTTRLVSGGYLLFEFGDGQEEAIRRLISATERLTMVDVKGDLRGIPRIAIARRD